MKLAYKQEGRQRHALNRLAGRFNGTTTFGVRNEAYKLGMPPSPALSSTWAIRSTLIAVEPFLIAQATLSTARRHI